MNLFQEAKNVLDKDGKVNALGPYGRQKLTGREMSTYFRRNKVKDAQIKKAVEVALDLGGAMDIARKEIKKFYGDKILKSKEVQQALQYANEEVFKEDLNKEDAVLEENYRVLAKKGMGAETKNSIKVGTEVDYYRDDGAKYMGKIIKMGPKSYIVKDMKNGKNYQFMYHDRVKAKQYLKQGDNINEKLDLVLTVKGDKNVALAKTAMKKFRGISVLRQGKVKSGQVAVFGGDEKQLQKMQSALAGQIKGLDMVSTHEMVSVNEADAEKKAELALKQTREKEALAKKHEREKESIADSYRRIHEDYAKDLDIAQKNMARLAKQEKGQEKKDYMAVARALNQGNLGAVKKVIKDINTDEIRADILNVLVGYNDLIAKMYPKAVDAKGRLKTPMSVGKMIKEEVSVMDAYRQMWAAESLSKADLKLISQMYDKKGKLTDVGKAVMDYKPGDNINKIVQDLNKKSK